MKKLIKKTYVLKPISNFIVFMLSTTLCETDKVLYALSNFGNSNTNTKYKKVVLRETDFAILYVCKTKTIHAGVTSS